MEISERRNCLALRVGPLRTDRFTLPCSNVSLAIERPRDFDHLLDEAATDPEQNLPYWAEIWPSGIALASTLLCQPDLVRGRNVLELGCGLGVTAIAAQMAGAVLMVTDYSNDAISLCLLNVLTHTGTEPRSGQVNWRDPAPSFINAIGSVQVMLAADALYEERDVAPLLALVESVLPRDGLLLLAEPGRVPASRFLTALAMRGWACSSERVSGPWPDPDDNRKGVVVGVHLLRRPTEMAAEHVW